LAGEPLIVHAVRRLVPIAEIVVAAPPDRVPEFTALLSGRLGPPVRVVAGGASRRESVAGALAVVDADVVLVHDAARPLVPPVVVERVLAALEAEAAAVVPVVPVVDTVKEVSSDGVVRTLDRAALRAVQTPQGFRREVLARAHADWRGGEPTDDAAMVEALGVSVMVVEGSPEAFKITRPLDLRLAEAVLAARS